MPLNIKDERADRLARELAEATGETITQAVTVAVGERLERVRGSAAPRGVAADLQAIGKRCAALPPLDERSPEEIIGYDSRGIPA